MNQGSLDLNVKLVVIANHLSVDTELMRLCPCMLLLGKVQFWTWTRLYCEIFLFYILLRV